MLNCIVNAYVGKLGVIVIVLWTPDQEVSGCILEQDPRAKDSHILSTKNNSVFDRKGFSYFFNKK